MNTCFHKEILHATLHKAMLNPFTAKDAIWHPRGITHLRICLSARYNFYYAASALTLKRSRLYGAGY